MSNNYNNIFNDLFKAFIDRNPFLVTSASKFTNNINSSNSEKILLNNMSLHDFQYFTDLKKELKNKKICNYITNIYCLLFNECMNINNDLRRKDMICSSLKQYLSNIIDEIKLTVNQYGFEAQAPLVVGMIKALEKYDLPLPGTPERTINRFIVFRAKKK